MGLPMQIPHDFSDPPNLLGDDRLAMPPDDAAIDPDLQDRLFAELVNRQGRFMFRVAHGLLRSPQDAEDTVQEVLLKLYRGDAWRAMDDEKAFLARTVWRTALDHIARRPKGSEPMDGLGEVELVANGDSPEQSVSDQGERVLLRRLIDCLPEELRQPLVLSAIEEMTSREVAIAMGIPEGTVRTRLVRARTELKRRFEAGRFQRKQPSKQEGTGR